MRFIGANPKPRLKGGATLPGRSNYLIGEKENWITGIPHFGEVRYADLYAGIDLVFYGNEGALEYDFVVAPGASPDSIRLAFDGVEEMFIAESGDLVLEVEPGVRVVHRAPQAYQVARESTKLVRSQFAQFDGNQVGFEVGPYDSRHPLTIDPKLVYSSYLGGGAIDRGYGIAVDSDGSAYVVGYTTSTNFPTEAPLDGTSNGSGDAFVTKVDPSGSRLVYSTYIGGTGQELARGIAVDAMGNAYVTGETGSSDFPTVSPLDGDLGGTKDGFLLKLNPSGSALVYSTYLGGSGDGDVGRAIVLDAARNAYVAGATNSSDFPTTSAMDGVFGGSIDAFILKVNAAGSGMDFSTFLGGSLDDTAYGVALDPSSNVYVTGRTGSYNFPTLNPVQGQATAVGSTFATKINSSGTSLVYSTYLGGSGAETAAGIAVNSAGIAHLVGVTNSSDFPTVNPLDGTQDGSLDAYLATLAASGSALIYSTYFGGSGEDQVKALALDSVGNIYLTGMTGSSDFTTYEPVQGTIAGSFDAFVSVIRADGTGILFSTYLGGSSMETLSATNFGGIALDDNHGIYVTGVTGSTNFPTLSAFQGTRGSSEDGYVAKLSTALDFFIAATELPLIKNATRPQ